VHPTPYYINVTNINLSSQEHFEKVLIGKDLSGNPIYDTIIYEIGFTQMIYNEDQKYFQPYISGSITPKMVSSWSKAEGYKWNGKYYFKTSIICNTQTSHRLTNGTKFEISLSIKGESNSKVITEKMLIYAKYRDGFVVEPDDSVGDYAVCTMKQTQYQALGTTSVYDVAFPADCVPDYAAFTFNGLDSATGTIETKHATVTINKVAQTLSVYLKADVTLIGSELEIRIPYRRPGDYVNPYLSVIVVPVYFELQDVEVIGHYESLFGEDFVTRLSVKSEDELKQLQYRASFDYNTNLLTSGMSGKMTAFNDSLKTASSISYINEGSEQITVEFGYTYLNGVPVLTKNGNCRFIRTFEYTINNTANAVVRRTEYLAVGTSATYTFYNWDPLYASDLYFGSGDYTAIEGLLDKTVKTQDRNTVNVTISFDRGSNNAGYKKLIENGKIVFNIYSSFNTTAPQIELTIIPVWFTFDSFKLKNNPVEPIVALTTPVELTVEAGDITAINDSDVVSAINTFNAELLNAQNNLANSTLLTFNRVANDDGILNFNFNDETRALTRADSANPVTATSYLLVSAGVKYVNGIPTLDNNGDRVSTYFSVCTYGYDIGDNNNSLPELDVAPNGRTRTVAQAIGTDVRYNIALPGVAYDARLDKYEIRIDGSYAWEKGFGWNAIFNVKESCISVSLDPNVDLFNKTLAILAYNREGELTYVLNIVPGYFTVEQILLADHIDENPVWIKNDETNWLSKLELDFVTNHVEELNGFDFETAINTFFQSLNSSSLVSRIDDAGYIYLGAGVNYENGIPQLANLVNAQTSVGNAYRYEMTDGIPETTKAQALGQEIVYNVNRPIGVIKISTGKDAEGNDIWEVYDSFSDWWVYYSVNSKSIRFGLSESETLLHKKIRVGIFANQNDAEPTYILNIIPAYFSVENLTVAGQSVEDRDIYLYQGDEIDSPDEVLFDAIYGARSFSQDLDVSGKIKTFENELHNPETNLIQRNFDANS
ncbi:MAG: hypothetical protein IJ295_00570, partial [Clostridia bacterium]|nr:hypothetical protein [Clostridia bacterium]